jgi:hypothetical protein
MAHPRYQLNPKDLERLGLSIYQQVNTAFAEYNLGSTWKLTYRGPTREAIAMIKRLCTESYANGLIEKMEDRPKTQKMIWTWEKDIKPPKLINFNMMSAFPEQPESDILQTVIRIHGNEVLNFITK